MAARTKNERTEWLPAWILMVLIAAAILTWLDRWLYSNEVFNSLSMGLSYSPQDATLVRLKQEALNYCAEFAPKSELKACNVYQNVITDRLYFAHPLTAVIGLQVRELLNRPNDLATLHRIALEPPLIGAAIALPIWFFLTMAIPRRDRTAAVMFMFLILFIEQCRDRGYFPVPDLIHDAGSWLAPLTLIGITAAAPGPIYLWRYLIAGE